MNLPVDDPARLRLEFAFPDGVFDHVCAECTAICCRGHGFGGSLRREMGQLLRMYPKVDALLLNRRGDCLNFTTSTAGCAFLEPDNRCGVEVKHGKALKPGSCTVFPFNGFFRLGDVLFVSPMFLCPLRLVVPARPGEVQGTHRTILQSIEESRILDAGLVRTIPALACHPGAPQEAVVARELAFRSACADGLGRARFVEVVRAQSADPDVLERSVAGAFDLMGRPAPARPADRDLVDDLMLAIAGPVRLGMLHLPAEAMLAALLLGENQLRRALDCGRAAPSLRDAHSLLSEAWPALELLALGDRTVELDPEWLPVTPHVQPDMVLASFIALRHLKDGVRTALTRALTPELSPADRFAMFQDLGRMVGDHLQRAAAGARRSE